MNTRFLFVISLIVTLFAVWFYRNQGDLQEVIDTSTTNIEYEATDILAVQTNDHGIAEYSLLADKLTHFSKENMDKLTDLKLNWRPSEDRSVVINADQALMYHDQSKVIMTNNVLFSSQSQQKDDQLLASDSPAMKLVAAELIGDLNQKKVYSLKPIEVTQGENSFKSDRFTADMNTGDYEFSQVAVTFMPPSRKDAALF